nr:unnamed protein product [Callosobruchus analis]
MLPPWNPAKCRLKCTDKSNDELLLLTIGSQPILKFSECSYYHVRPLFSFVTGTLLEQNIDKPTLNNIKIRICKQFFIATIAINSTIIKIAVRKKLASGVLDVRAYINSILRVESHYCRSNTAKKYIEGGKTIADLHRDYVRLCEDLRKSSVNYIMNYNSPEEEKKNLQKQFDTHMQEKTHRGMKKTQMKDHMVRWSLSLIYKPHYVALKVKRLVFTVSKLSVYNFTIYDLQSTDTFCFV